MFENNELINDNFLMHRQFDIYVYDDDTCRKIVDNTNEGIVYFIRRNAETYMRINLIFLCLRAAFSVRINTISRFYFHNIYSSSKNELTFDIQKDSQLKK